MSIVKKYSKEYKQLEADLLNTGVIDGVESLLFMWTEHREGFKEYLISRGFKNLGTDDGVSWLYQMFNL